MNRIVHLSDLHFGTESPVVLAALERAIGELEPDIVVVSGDLTQRARRTEFAAARRFVDALPGRHVVVPGNHDIPLFNPVARALWPFRRYHETFGPSGTALVEHGALRLVTVNSVRRERHAEGHVTRARRLAVAAIARAAPAGAVTVVVAHHPLGTTRSDGSPREDRRTLEHWRRAGVRLVLSGHEHRAFLRRGGEGRLRGATAGSSAGSATGPAARTDGRVSDGSATGPATGPTAGTDGRTSGGSRTGSAARMDGRASGESATGPAKADGRTPDGDDVGELWVLNAGTALSRRLRHARPNSFNVVDVPEARDGATNGDGTGTLVPLTIERHDFDVESATFTLGERRRTDEAES